MILDIRAATNSDAQAIGDLLAELGYPVEPADLLLRLDRFTSVGNGRVLVAVADGVVRGFAAVEMTYPIHHSNPVAHLSSFAVGRPVRRQGIGRRLLGAVEQARPRTRRSSSDSSGAGLALTGAALFYQSIPLGVYAGTFLLITHVLACCTRNRRCGGRLRQTTSPIVGIPVDGGRNDKNDLVTMKTYLLSLPERLVRATLGVAAGVAREVGEVALPKGIRSSQLYQNLVDASLRFLIEQVGGAEGVYKADEALTDRFLARRAAGNAVEMLGIVAFRASPVWVLAALADLCGMGRHLIPEMADALKAQGLLEKDVHFTSVDQMLDGLERTSSRIATTINTPPLDVAGLRKEWDAIRTEARSMQPVSLPSRETIAQLWTELKTESVRQNRSVFETSSMIAVSAVRTLPDGARWVSASARVGATRAGHIFATALLDHYRQTLREIQQGGYGAYASRQLRPYVHAAVAQFSSKRRTFTERVFEKLRVITILSLALSVPADGQSQDAGVGCVPIGERAGRAFGCFILESQPLGQLERAATFWHLETFPTRAAADSAKSARGAVVEAFDKIWLLSIADAGWRTAGATHVAEIGPLPTKPGIAYTAQFMEAVFRPGMKSRVHRHAGPEAWYTITGETCLETPDGTMVGRAGGAHVVVPQGPPMELTATGSETRQALVLILHESAHPHTSPAPDWTPKGLCKA